MTILVGLSASRQSDAPLNLAWQIAQCTDRPVIAATVVERARPATDDPVENQYLRYLTTQVQQSLDQLVGGLPGNNIPTVVHQSSSIPMGLIELTEEHAASLVVVGSSSSGLLGRVTLGSVTDRLVHTAGVPVAIAPRGYPRTPGPLRRITAAYGAAADVNGLIRKAAELAEAWSVALRIVSFTVRPMLSFASAMTTSAEELIINQWARRTHDELARQLDEVRSLVPVAEVEVVVGAGWDWRGAVEDVPWVPGDILALGSGAAGHTAKVFLGSAASKILRHSPVPVVIVPRPERE